MTAPPAPDPGAVEPDPREGTAAGLGRLVMEARQARGMSQAQLAHRAGLRRELVGRIERGQANPTLVVLISLADGLGYTIEELVGRECRPAGTARPRS